MVEVRRGEGVGSCYFPREVVGVNVGLAFVDGFIAVLALSQLIKIHSRNSRCGWTRQEVFHILIGSSNIAYSIYFVLTIIATCERWLCWSYSCGFVLMALPKILSFTAFLLLLSFWVDLCHQADDEDYEEEEFSFREALLEVTPSQLSSPHSDGHRMCFPFRLIRVGSRQKIVILVTFIIFVLTIIFAVLIGVGMGSNVMDSSWLARVYVYLFATAVLLLGGALACYGFLLCSKMRRVRSDRAASEMHKVAGMAAVSLLCFASSSCVAFLTQIPVLYYCQELETTGLYTSLLLILYYFIGSSVPSAFVLLIMRDSPHAVPANVHEESTALFCE